MTRTVNERLLSRVVDHHIEIQRLAAGDVGGFVRQLNDSDPQIFDVIRRYSSPSGLVTASRVETILRSIQNINNRTYRSIGTDAARSLQDLAKYEVDFISNLVEDTLPVDITLARPRASHVRAIVREEQLMGGLFSEWIDGMASGRYTRIRQAVRLGVAAGETTDEVTSRIRGKKSLNYRDGALAVSRRSADSILTSWYNYIAVLAGVLVFTANPRVTYGVEWTAVLDDVTCDECAALDGEQFDIRETGLEPPLHPNCRCVLSPLVDDWSSLGYASDELTDSQKAQLDGKKPDVLRYEQWLADQDLETQQTILGKDRAALYRRGALPIKKFVDHSGRRYTLAELKKIERRKLKVPPPPSLTSVIRMRNYGWKPDFPDKRDYQFGVNNPEDLAVPTRVSLRDKMPPVFNQGSLGACTANALVAAVMYAFGPKTPMLSRLDLYYKERLLEDAIDFDGGAAIRDGVRALAKWGVCTEATWPYKVRSFRTQPPAAAAAEDQNYRIKSYERLKTHEDFMKCLTKGNPFVIGFSIYQNFDEPIVENKGILMTPTITQKMVGGHAVLVTGYDNDFLNSQTFRDSGLQTSQVSSLMYEVRNSFGEAWGEDGYFWIPGEYLEDRDLSDDAWVIYK